MSLRLLLSFAGLLAFLLIAFDAWYKSKKLATGDLDEDSLRKQRELERELPYGQSRKIGEAIDGAFNEDITFADDPIPLLKKAIDEQAQSPNDFMHALKSEPELEIPQIQDFSDLEQHLNNENETTFQEPKLDFDFAPNDRDKNDSEILDMHIDNAGRNLYFNNEQENSITEQEVEEDGVLFEAPITKGLVELEKNLWRSAKVWIYIRVKADEGREYNLAEFWNFCQNADLRYSERGFIHRFLEREDSNHIQFSIINAMEPGNLVVNREDSFSQGFILMQVLPGGYKPEKILEDMYDIAKAIVANFGGNILDEDHSAFTDQTLQFYKEQIRKFILKQKLPNIGKQRQNKKGVK